MPEKHFGFADALGYGWDVMKSNFWFFAGIGITYVIINVLPDILDAMVRRLPIGTPAVATLGLVLGIVGAVVGIVLQIGLVRIALAFHDGLLPDFGTLFDAWGCFWRYTGTMALYGLIIFAGAILFIIPGVVWAIKFSLCHYFVIDVGLGPIDALKASSRTTMGVKWQLFGFGFLCALIAVLGMLCFVVGMFAAYPTIIMANAYIYRKLAAQTPELSGLNIIMQSVQPLPQASTSLPVNENFEGGTNWRRGL